jgi:hypothetical protein
VLKLPYEHVVAGSHTGKFKHVPDSRSAKERFFEQLTDGRFLECLVTLRLATGK